MKKIYTYLAGAVMAAASLASCSSNHFAFAPSASAYHSVAVHAPSSTTSTEELSAVNSAERAATAPKPTVLTEPQSAKHLKQQLITATPAAAPLSAAKRIVVAKVAKQLHKHAEVAKASQEQSRAGRAGLVIGIGAVLILIGGLIGGTNIVATIGGIAFIVGLILLIIALISGK
ncbi:hypothetical protein HMJ29_02830 [Hymenobacter taeanensis]|uniref:Uncharacterized protein n=1 Tax=Hymenobacter taeanensis TaxID=2735321 RepID=A0A6M6BDL5_9BACT|nr:MULTISPECIES: hypothetical protein [Hymenobacter]QJX45928.1 hypothetical protein HMJ29_02830 [Hymenobacter taeanensis]UOQ79774.1 hypothetical protein MUN83_13065 [Hymenobacter sp. 5414T-23]